MAAPNSIERLGSLVEIAQKRKQILGTPEQLTNWNKEFDSRFNQVLATNGRPVRERYTVHHDEKIFEVSEHVWETSPVSSKKDPETGLSLFGVQTVYGAAFTSVFPEWRTTPYFFQKSIIYGDLNEDGTYKNTNELIVEGSRSPSKMWGYPGGKRFDLTDVGIASGILVVLDNALPAKDQSEDISALARGEERSSVDPDNPRHRLTYDELISMGYRLLSPEEANARERELVPGLIAIRDGIIIPVGAPVENF